MLSKKNCRYNYLVILCSITSPRWFVIYSIVIVVSNSFPQSFHGHANDIFALNLCLFLISSFPEWMWRSTFYIIWTIRYIISPINRVTAIPTITDMSTNSLVVSLASCKTSSICFKKSTSSPVPKLILPPTTLPTS